MRLFRRFARARAGVAAIEFAVVAPLLIVLTMGVMEAALLGWTQVVIQLTASQTARCMALGTSACSNPMTFAVNTANSWLFPDAVTTANVTLQSSTTCGSAPGHYAKVTVTAQFAGMPSLPDLLGGGLLTAHACYYKGA
jgi:Flp pilus assembly protein TadG